MLLKNQDSSSIFFISELSFNYFYLMKDMFMWLQHLEIQEVQSLMDFQDLVKKKSKSLLYTKISNASRWHFYVNNRKRLAVFVMYPKNGTSKIQRKQMVTCDSPNVKVLGVNGNFDDCQRMVKSLLSDKNMNKITNFKQCF